MKKCSSVVWRFFERIENEQKRCMAVLCKLCDTQYKFFGNTTNLRSHLINKHPLQWELSQNSPFEETSFHVEDEESNQSTVTPKKRKFAKSYKDRNVRYSLTVDNPRSKEDRIPKIEIQRVDVLDSLDDHNDPNETEDNEATFNLVRQLHNSRGSDEEWLEDDTYATSHIDSYDRKRRPVPYRKIKKEAQSPRRNTISAYNNSQSVRYEKSQPIIIDQSNLKDEYSVFGEYVANKLRKFKAPRTRGNLQQLITTILWQAEYGTYDNADAVKRVLMYTVHEPEQEQPQEVHIHQDMSTDIQTEEVIINSEQNQSAEAESLNNVE